MFSLIKTLFRIDFNESDMLKPVRKRGFIAMSRQRRYFYAKFNGKPLHQPLKLSGSYGMEFVTVTWP